jgi:hypothetical protein
LRVMADDLRGYLDLFRHLSRACALNFVLGLELASLRRSHMFLAREDSECSALL